MNSLSPNQHATLKILIADTSSKAPISNLMLSKKIGMRERRSGVEGGDMRSIIHALRVKGFPVCANGRGYFYARTDAELSKFILAMQNRLQSQEDALKGLKESFHNVGKIGGDDALPPSMTKVYLKTPMGTVRKCEVEMDEFGDPIIPEGYSKV